jgi:hypothetical protein
LRGALLQSDLDLSATALTIDDTDQVGP